MSTFGKVDKIGKPSPVRYFIDVRSNKELETVNFKCYDRDTQQKIGRCPTEFVLLKTTNGVTGWDDVTNSGAFSNEVANTQKEPLKICADGGKKVLFEWLYDKEKIKALWLKFTKFIYTLEDGAVCKYNMQGKNVFIFNEDTSVIDFNEYKIKLGDIETMKNGAVTYYVPRWTQGKKLTKDEIEEATNSVELLEEYLNDNE